MWQTPQKISPDFGIVIKITWNFGGIPIIFPDFGENYEFLYDFEENTKNSTEFPGDWVAAIWAEKRLSRHIQLHIASYESLIFYGN